MVNIEENSDQIIQGSKKKNKKRTTLNFNEFVKLTSGPGPLPSLPLRKSKMDERNVDNYDSSIPVISNIVLPTAPKSACNIEITDPRLPMSPPFSIYVSNLPYDFEDDELNAIFENISSMNIPRDETKKSKGCASIEFHSKEALVIALNLPEITLRSRRLRIDLMNECGGMSRRRFDLSSDDRRFSENMLSDWRSGPRTEISNDLNRRNGFKSYKSDVDSNRSDSSNWRSELNSNSNNSYVAPKRGFENSRNDFRFNKSDDNESKMKERPKLFLCPRSKPLNDNVTDVKIPNENNSIKRSSIFGNAKPVDTASREREIEDKLLQNRQAPVKHNNNNESNQQVNVNNVDEKPERKMYRSPNVSNVDEKPERKMYRPPNIRNQDSDTNSNSTHDKKLMKENQIQKVQANSKPKNDLKNDVVVPTKNKDFQKNRFSDNNRHSNSKDSLSFINTNKYACLDDEINDD